MNQILSAVGPTRANPDDDPFLHLEEINGARALHWVAAQNQRTLAAFADASFESDRDTIAAIMQRPDRIPAIGRRDGLVYNVWRDAKNPRGVIRRTTLESYRLAEPVWESVLDIDALAKAEGEDWIFKGGANLPGSPDMTILMLSRGGSDAAVMREFDRSTKTFVKGGFYVPEAKGSCVILDRDTLLLSSAVGGAEMQTAAGYARTVRLLKRGQKIEDAKVIFETDRSAMAAGASVDHEDPAKTVYLVEQIDFFNVRVFQLLPDGSKRLIDLPTDAQMDGSGDILLVKPRTSVRHGEYDYVADTLLATSYSDFMAGKRDFRVLFEPGPRKVLEGFSLLKGKLLLNIKDNLCDRYQLLDYAEGDWRPLPLPKLPDVGMVSLWDFDADPLENNGDLLLSINDPVTPASLLLVPSGSTTPELLKTSPSVFDTTDIKVSRHEAISEDGESIPYVQVGRVDESGEAPVYMTGYGGFGLATQPHYDGVMGKQWLEQGGTVIYTHLRGGGEFGTAWHDAGRREKKAMSHADFAAIAGDLVRRGVTVPKRIAAEGGSNGGLLIANMLTRYHDRFGALFCTIPLIDMRRYTKLLAGHSWIAEYGDPDVAEDWDFIRHFSAYHTAEPGKAYPPILIATTKADDRVHPGHARKFAAKLQAMGYHQAYAYEPQTGGHGYGKDATEVAAFKALGLRFLKKMIGWH